MATSEKIGPGQPLFEPEALADQAAVDDAVEAYRRKQITHAELVERVRAVADQYDPLSRELMFEEIESTLGEDIPELWTPRKVQRRARR